MPNFFARIYYFVFENRKSKISQSLLIVTEGRDRIFQSVEFNDGLKVETYNYYWVVVASCIVNCVILNKAQ